MKWSRSKYIRIGLVLHFALLLSGMFQLSFLKLEKTGRLLELYGRLTGARGSFGFFSPNVGNQFVVHFEIIDKEGKSRKIHLEELVSSETAIRIGNMHRLFTETYKEEKLRRALAASMATHFFEVIPNVQKVKFAADLYLFPGLKAYEMGMRPKQNEVYRATFEHKGKPS